MSRLDSKEENARWIASEATLVVDDSSEFRAKEAEIRAHISADDAVQFYYTDYEDGLTRLFHKTPAIGNVLYHLTFWLKSSFVALQIFMRFRARNKLFVNPIVGIFYCGLSRLAGREERVGLAGFLFVRKRSSIYLSLRKRFTVFCCAKATYIFVYSQSEVAEYSQMFPTLSQKLRFVHYGRDFDLFGRQQFDPDQVYIASGGVSNRDFNTLAKALSILWDQRFPVHCKIATRTGHEEIGSIPPNLDIRYDIRIDQFGDFLRKSQLVVLPLRQTPLSGGHMVLLEALSIGKLVIVANTPGVRDYVGDDCAILYEPENAVDLAQRIRCAIENFGDQEFSAIASNGRTLFWSTYTHGDLLRRLIANLNRDEIIECAAL